MRDVTPDVLFLFLAAIKVLLYVALYGILLWMAWGLVRMPKDKPRPNRWKG